MTSAKTNTCFGRATETERIKNVLNAWQAAPAKTSSFKILGISGYGGVGKSFLLNSMLNELQTSRSDAFTIQIDGSNKQILGDFISLIDEKLAPSRVSFKGAQLKDDQFPETRKLISYQRKLSKKVATEIGKKDCSEDIKKVARFLYKFSPQIKKIPQYGPQISSALKFSEEQNLEEHTEDALKLLKNLKTLNQSGHNPFRKLRISPIQKLTNTPLLAISEAYEADIRSRLVGYEKKNFFKLSHRKAKGINRLLLVIDDYEFTGKVLDELLVNNLFIKFKDAPYPILVIIVGRDDIRETNPEFSKSLSPFIADRISLKPFTKEEGILFLEHAGYDTIESEKLYDESNGYPYVLSLLADFKSNQGDRPALFYQQFFERTTQWMTDQQKDWLLPLCYLDSVNTESIQEILPQAPELSVMDWFRREASVRDINSPTFKVDPYIEKMLLQHHLNFIGPKEQKRLIEQGNKASSPSD